MAATYSGPSPAAGADIWVALVSTDQRTLTLVWDRCPEVGAVLLREKSDVVEVGVEVPKSCGGDISGRQWVGATVTLSRPLAQRKVVNVTAAPRNECD
jgi:hypothetical protein